MASPERIGGGTQNYEIIDSVELARRWVLPASWVREHVRSRVTDPIPHIRFGRYVRFRWGSPELEGWLAEHMSILANECCDAQPVRPRQSVPAGALGNAESRWPIGVLAGTTLMCHPV
jgi:hypothetical protein